MKDKIFKVENNDYYKEKILPFLLSICEKTESWQGMNSFRISIKNSNNDGVIHVIPNIYNNIQKISIIVQGSEKITNELEKLIGQDDYLNNLNKPYSPKNSE